MSNPGTKGQALKFEPFDRAAFLHVLGWDGGEFRYEERCGNLVVRRWDYVGGKPHPALGGQELSRRPSFVIRHREHRLSERPALEPKSLWKELFPFPFDEFGGENGSERELIEPPLLRHAFGEAARALNAFGRRLASDELIVVSWSGPGGEIQTWLQFFRQRRIHCGAGLSVGGTEVSLDHAGAGSSGAGFSAASYRIEVPAREDLSEQVVALARAVEAATSPRRIPLLGSTLSRGETPLLL